MRARTSSPRLVSWVVNVIIAVRPQPRPDGGALVELGDADPEPLGFAADLVERHQPRVAVEQAVLHRLGGRRTAQLLEARRGLAAGADGRGDTIASGSARSGRATAVSASAIGSTEARLR